LDKIVGKQEELILFYGCGKAIDEAQVILSRLTHPLKPMEKEKGWQPI
jgi:hypothetical protein